MTLLKETQRVTRTSAVETHSLGDVFVSFIW